jgi:hypothetical protein
VGSDPGPIRSPAKVEGRAHRSTSRSEARRGRCLEALKEGQVFVEWDLPPCPSLAERRHVTGRGREVAVEREEVSGAA